MTSTKKTNRPEGQQDIKRALMAKLGPVERIPFINIITEEEVYQTRVFQANELPQDARSQEIRSSNVVRTLVEKLQQQAGTRFRLEPLWVKKRPDGTYIVIDGHHRYEAYWVYTDGGKKNRTYTVPCKVFSGSDAEAWFLSGAENQKVKMPLTKAEQIQAAWELLAIMPHYLKGKSQRELALALSISSGKVNDMLQTLTKIRTTAPDYPKRDEAGVYHHYLWKSVKSDNWENEPKLSAEELQKKRDKRRAKYRNELRVRFGPVFQHQDFLDALQEVLNEHGIWSSLRITDGEDKYGDSGGYKALDEVTWQARSEVSNLDVFN
jgi:hypothetical protein